jgi:hypothetical protein
MSWSGLPDTVRTVECAVADFTSVARGKVVARADFEAMRGCKLPSVVLGVTLTGASRRRCSGRCRQRHMAICTLNRTWRLPCRWQGISGPPCSD